MELHKICYAGALEFEIRELIKEFKRRNGDINRCKICMNYNTYRELKNKVFAITESFQANSYYGIDIVINDWFNDFEVAVCGDTFPSISTSTFGIDLGNFKYNKGGTMKFNSKPKQVCFNKDATVLIWYDGDKTISHCDDKDNYDPVIGFLYAYYFKHVGLSKIKAKKYLDEVKEMYDKQTKKKAK